MRAMVSSSRNFQIKRTRKQPVPAKDVTASKKTNRLNPEELAEQPEKSCFASLDDNLLHEILKLTNVSTLSAAACVDKQWRRVAEEERLWELIYKQNWADLEDMAQWLEFLVRQHAGSYRQLHTLPMF